MRFRFGRLGATLDSIAPQVCLLVLLAGILLSGLGEDPVLNRANAQRESRIREAFARFPTALGERNQWILVQDVPIPSSQADMLGLNAYVSRQYQRLGVFPPMRATVFLANSYDARSMTGHHPPNCYPASGWIMDESLSMVHNFTAASGRSLPTSVYHFARGGDTGRRLWVVNGFLVPGGRAVATLDETREATARSQAARSGLTQYQIVLNGEIPLAAALEYADEIVRSMPSDLLEVISVKNAPPGQQADGERP